MCLEVLTVVFVQKSGNVYSVQIVISCCGWSDPSLLDASRVPFQNYFASF